MEVELRVAGTPRALPRLVERSVYRIVQESLTNVAKHSGNAPTSVWLEYTERELVVSVIDAGTARYVNGSNGQGLVGMRERVEILGGQLFAGPRAGGGFAIRAEIPIGR